MLSRQQMNHATCKSFGVLDRWQIEIRQNTPNAHFDDTAFVVPVTAPHEVLVSEARNLLVREYRRHWRRRWRMRDCSVCMLNVRAESWCVEAVSMSGECAACLIDRPKTSHEQVTRVLAEPDTEHAPVQRCVQFAVQQQTSNR
jgi:hypothetical protein